MTKRFSTPDLSDLHPETFAMDIQFKSFGKKEYFCGQVMTAQCPNDNSKVKEILNRNGSGQVLVVDGLGSTKVALLGDMLAQQAIDNSWEGIIINGCVRDVEILRNLPIGVFAIGSCPIKSNKQDLGVTGQPLEIGGVKVEKGSWIYADETGVLLSKVELEVN
ncbi:MAG: ribonuclease E activity regulator RraA [Pseudomonadota bacterium]|nr:ribonuclease E activity regulator RraA [Pseudomonadota bacterium]